MEDHVAALLRDGEAAARVGQKASARRKFRAALARDPANVTALLWLAWLNDDPRASLVYVARALTVEPHNPQAHAALRWARCRASSPEFKSSFRTLWIRNRIFSKKPGFLIIVGLLIIFIGSVLISSRSTDAPALAALATAPSPTTIATVTVSPTSTPIPTPSPPPSHILPPIPSHTPTPTLTLTPTVTPRPILPTAPPLPPTLTLAPSSISSTAHWIDVDLTQQTLTAYAGPLPVRTMFVSTGLPRTPTLTGRYWIQTKLRYDDMSGPGYYLSDVPYVMYFYGGYGLHGAYWHSNFGHPMSHGCVNLPTSEAEWLFNWAVVGTPITIHY